jgi:transposase
MSGVVGHIAWQERAQELRARYQTEQDVGHRTRLLALWLVRSGRAEQEAATVAGVGRRTLTRWLAWYRQGGLAAVLRRVPGHGSRGASSRLTPAQRAALLARCAQGAFRTYGEAQHWVEHECGVTDRYAGIYDLLARAPARSLFVPVPVHAGTFDVPHDPLLVKCVPADIARSPRSPSINCASADGDRCGPPSILTSTDNGLTWTTVPQAVR